MNDLLTIETPVKLENHHLNQGELHVTSRPKIITTILGSCVSICFWDEGRAVGGMNHYVLSTWSGRDNSTYRYGDVANYALFDKMRMHGSEVSDLRALIIGGGNMLQEGSGLQGPGMENIALAKDFIANIGVRNVRNFTGGNFGRKIHFNTSNGEVEIIKVGSIFRAA